MVMFQDGGDGTLWRTPFDSEVVLIFQTKNPEHCSVKLLCNLGEQIGAPLYYGKRSGTSGACAHNWNRGHSTFQCLVLTINRHGNENQVLWQVYQTLVDGQNCRILCGEWKSQKRDTFLLLEQTRFLVINWSK